MDAVAARSGEEHVRQKEVDEEDERVVVPGATVPFFFTREYFFLR